MCKYLLQDTCHGSHLSPVQAAPVHGHGSPDEPAAPPADRQHALSSRLFRYHWKIIQTIVPTSTNSPRFRVRWISQMSRGAAWFLEDFRFFILSSSFFWTSSHDFARPGEIWSFSFTILLFWVLRGLDRTGILLLLLLATDDVVDAKDTAEGGLKNTPVMYVSTNRYFYTVKIAHTV